jgi:hypothetical protein
MMGAGYVRVSQFGRGKPDILFFCFFFSFFFQQKGDGTSCLCLGGYLDFTKEDADAGVLCHVDNSLVSQIDVTINSLEILQRQLALSSCEISKQLNFDQWLATMNTFCSGDACPAQPEPNLFQFLSANTEFSLQLKETLGQIN